MVTVTDNKLTIEIEHVSPADLVNELRESLIFQMQNVSYGDEMELAEIKNTNYFMLLLLKEMLEVRGLGKERL